MIDKAAHLVKIDDVPIDLSVKEFETFNIFCGKSEDGIVQRKDTEQCVGL